MDLFQNRINGSESFFKKINLVMVRNLESIKTFSFWSNFKFMKKSYFYMNLGISDRGPWKQCDIDFHIFMDFHELSLMFMFFHWFSGIIVDFRECSWILVFFINFHWFTWFFVKFIWFSWIFIDFREFSLIFNT